MKSKCTISRFRVPFSGRKWLMILVVFAMSTGIAYSQVAINNDNSAPNASAMLDVKATGLGFLAPRMAFALRPAAPATGLLIYQTDVDPGFYYYDGAAWQKVGRASSDFWLLNGSDIYYNAGRVAIGGNTSEAHGLYVQNYNYGKGAVRGTDQNGANIYAEGMLGVLTPNDIGFPISIYNAGVMGIKPNNGANGGAVAGWNNDDNDLNYGGVFATDGLGAIANYGIYSSAGNSTGNNYAGYFKGRVEVEANSAGSDYFSPALSSRITHNLSYDSYAIEGTSVPTPGYGFGLYATGGYRGVFGFGDGTDYVGSVIGVYGYCSGSAGTRYGVYGYGYNSGGSAIGVYGYASGTSASWAGYFSGSTYISTDLRVATTTAATGYAVSVNGKIACEEVLVQDAASWPDYVFDEKYNLMSLEDLERSINKNNHLPGLPSAETVKENGFELADMQKRILEKVEELTLYTIEQDKQIKNLQQEMENLKKENASLKKAVNRK